MIAAHWLFLSLVGLSVFQNRPVSRSDGTSATGVPGRAAKKSHACLMFQNRNALPVPIRPPLIVDVTISVIGNDGNVIG
jgi:hypothetical protein